MKLFRLQFNLVNFLVLALLLHFLTGCAITPETRAQAAPIAVTPSQDEGIVTLKISTNRSTVSLFFVKWTMLRIRNLETDKKFTLYDKADSFRSYSLFVDALPNGTYSIESFGNIASGWLTVSSSASARDSFPTFTIASGQLTELGTITYIRAHFPVNSSLFAWGQLANSFDQRLAINHLNPSVATSVSKQPILSWNANDLLYSRIRTHSALKINTLSILSNAILPDGRILFGESFGQIAVRNLEGRWSFWQVPSSVGVRTLYVGVSGEIYAGTDDGLLFESHDDGITWKSMDLPIKDASVLFIGELPTSRDLFVVFQSRDKFVAYSLDLKTKNQWIEQFNKARKMYRNPQMDARGAVFNGGNRLTFLSGNFDSQLEAVDYDNISNSWKSVSINESDPPTRWISLGDGTIGRFRGIPLTGMYFAVSSDGGVSWEKRGDLNWVRGSPVFSSKNIGFVIRTDSIPLYDPQKIELSLWKTLDGGRTWSKIGPMPGIHGDLVLLGETESLGYATADGKFFVSGNGGQTWRLERQVD
jgi:photosystem II stability/assembly factor-like uncharacterized protein